MNEIVPEAGLPDRLKRQGLPAKPGIIHFGPGAFFRAFLAQYTHDAMAASGGDWGIIAASLRSREALRQLERQGGVYTAVTLGPEGDETRKITSISEVLDGAAAPERLVARLADPNIRIVTLTVTEKGYCHAPSTGKLNTDDPEIRHDLGNPSAPKSVPGFLVAGLAARRSASIPPFAILSCDNLPSNGTLVRGIILEFARALDPELANWIDARVAFPGTMVDRITPASTPEDRDRFESVLGYRDEGIVLHEPFAQWVIEDVFPHGRPDWAAAGAQLVKSVEAHEKMKLRCLNGTHSALAYLGFLAGHETIADTVADAPFAGLCNKLWADEILPTVQPPVGEDMSDYAAALLGRYRNPAIRHRTWQIAMDGSQKIPQRLLGTIRDRLEAGALPLGLCLAVAGWMRYVGGTDEMGGKIDVRDPLADRLKAASDGAASPAGKVSALLEFREVFGDALAGDPKFRTALSGAYETLVTRGARAAVVDYVT